MQYFENVLQILIAFIKIASGKYLHKVSGIKLADNKLKRRAQNCDRLKTYA